MWCAQAEPISAQVDAYMGWLAEFEPSFVMLAASKSLVQQGGHDLDISSTGSRFFEKRPQEAFAQPLVSPKKPC